MSNLYQLATPDKRINGSYFHVNGPYDKHGFVVSSTKRVNKWGKTDYLNLVRGTGNKKTCGANYHNELSKPTVKPLKEQKTFNGMNYNQLSKAFLELPVRVRNGRQWIVTQCRRYREITLWQKTDYYLIIERPNGDRIKVLKNG